MHRPDLDTLACVNPNIPLIGKPAGCLTVGGLNGHLSRVCPSRHSSVYVVAYSHWLWSLPR